MDSILADCTQFVQRLIQTPSMPGEEAAIAGLIAAELRLLDYDEVWQDEIGNVFGRMWGRDRTLPALVLNTHLDHVDPGDLNLWPVPPYSGEIHDSRIVGRGASDIKGPLAVQVYSAAALRKEGQRPLRDIVFSGVVEEETGGAGAKFWAENLDYPVEMVIVGEPSSNNLALGHRGVMQLWVTFQGRSVHASAPDNSQNPNYALAAFLERLQQEQGSLQAHPLLGATSVAPTIVEVDTRSQNVTPAWTRVLLDFRTGAESPLSLYTFVDKLAGDWPHTITYGFHVDSSVYPPTDTEPVAGFYTPPDHPLVERMVPLLTEGMGRPPELTRYAFATDGRHFAQNGLTVVGYAPGDEEDVHTAGESISIASLEESLRGHIALLRDF